MRIDTYFGFFATAVFTAMAGSIGGQTRSNVVLDGVALSATNTLKLRWSEIETVMLPAPTVPMEVSFVMAASGQDMKSLAGLAAGRVSLQKLMEGAVSTALEPFNFVARTRAKLNGLNISRNVTGFTAHHLQGEVNYTMAEGRFRVPPSTAFSLRLLVTAEGLDLIENRVTEKGPQRALFSINEGAYVCSPQWEPPEPPPGMESGESLEEIQMNGWLQSLFAHNSGQIPLKLFRQPVALRTELGGSGLFDPYREEDATPTVVRLVLNGDKALELYLLLLPDVVATLMQLSRSGQERFVGDFFRALFGEAAGLWERFAGTPVRWSVAAVRKIPAAAVNQIVERTDPGGLVMRQSLIVDEGRLEWLLALGPHTWHALMGLTAKALDIPVEGIPERKAIFAATGWGGADVSWPHLIERASERELLQMVRVLGQADYREAHLAAIAAALEPDRRQRWMTAMPVMQRERAEGYELAEGEAGVLLRQLTHALMRLHQEGKAAEGKLADWLTIFGELYWARRQNLIDRLLPLRHLIYGFDRGSLSRMLFDVPDRVLVPLLCGAEFPVVDQVRRAISPGFALRLLEDVQVRRPRTTACAVQEAQIELYRRCMSGMAEGRYMVRETPAKRLRSFLHWLDEPS